MPYNTTAIAPSEDSTGAAILPLARVKKAIAADEDIGAVSAQAAFVITKATELFIQYMSEKAFASAKADSKVKRTLMYRDLANVINRTDNLEFASDLVPQTTTWAAHKEKKAREAGSRKSNPLSIGQTTLDPKRPQSSHMVMQINTPPPSGPSTMNGTRTTPNGGLVFQHYEPKVPKEKVDSQVDMDMK